MYSRRVLDCDVRSDMNFDSRMCACVVIETFVIEQTFAIFYIFTMWKWKVEQI